MTEEKFNEIKKDCYNLNYNQIRKLQGFLGYLQDVRKKNKRINWRKKSTAALFNTDNKKIIALQAPLECPNCKGNNHYIEGDSWYCPNCWNLFGSSVPAH